MKQVHQKIVRLKTLDYNMTISKHDIELLRNIRIHDILNIPLNKEKVSIKCPCLGHNDSTPSFLLDSKNSYYCFGCGAKGSGAIDFTMDALDCDFQTAVQELLSML